MENMKCPTCLSSYDLENRKPLLGTCGCIICSSCRLQYYHGKKHVCQYCGVLSAFETEKFHAELLQNLQTQREALSSISIRNFPISFQEEQLRNMCKSFGEISKIKILGSVGPNKGSAIIVFDSPTSAINALNELQHLKMGNTSIHAVLGATHTKPVKSTTPKNKKQHKTPAPIAKKAVQKVQPTMKAKKPESSAKSLTSGPVHGRSVVVTNLHPNTARTEILATFALCGEIERCNVIENGDSPYAEIVFQNQQSSAKALGLDSKIVFHDQKVKISKMLPPSSPVSPPSDSVLRIPTPTPAKPSPKDEEQRTVIFKNFPLWDEKYIKDFLDPVGDVLKMDIRYQKEMDPRTYLFEKEVAVVFGDVGTAQRALLLDKKKIGANVLSASAAQQTTAPSSAQTEHVRSTTPAPQMPSSNPSMTQPKTAEYAYRPSTLPQNSSVQKQEEPPKPAAVVAPKTSTLSTQNGELKAPPTVRQPLPKSNFSEMPTTQRISQTQYGRSNTLNQSRYSTAMRPIGYQARDLQKPYVESPSPSPPNVVPCEPKSAAPVSAKSKNELSTDESKVANEMASLRLSQPTPTPPSITRYSPNCSSLSEERQRQALDVIPPPPLRSSSVTPGRNDEYSSYRVERTETVERTTTPYSSLTQRMLNTNRQLENASSGMNEARTSLSNTSRLRKIRVSNLPQQRNRSELRKRFELFGEILNISWDEDGNYVDFTYDHSALIQIQREFPIIFNGNKLSVNVLGENAI